MREDDSSLKRRVSPNLKCRIFVPCSLKILLLAQPYDLCHIFRSDFNLFFQEDKVSVTRPFSISGVYFVLHKPALVKTEIESRLRGGCHPMCVITDVQNYRV